MVFNLIPIPPLDGGRILVSVLPYAPARALSALEPYGMVIILLLIMFDPQIHIIHTILGTVVQVLTGSILAGIVL